MRLDVLVYKSSRTFLMRLAHSGVMILDGVLNLLLVPFGLGSNLLTNYIFWEVDRKFRDKW